MAETSGGLVVRLFTLFCVVKLERRVVNSDRVFALETNQTDRGQYVSSSREPSPFLIFQVNTSFCTRVARLIYR